MPSSDLVNLTQSFRELSGSAAEGIRDLWYSTYSLAPDILAGGIKMLMLSTWVSLQAA